MDKMYELRVAAACKAVGEALNESSEFVRAQFSDDVLFEAWAKVRTRKVERARHTPAPKAYGRMRKDRSQPKTARELKCKENREYYAMAEWWSERAALEWELRSKAEIIVATKADDRYLRSDAYAHREYEETARKLDEVLL